VHAFTKDFAVRVPDGSNITKTVLSTADSTQIYSSETLVIYYLLIFMTAEAAFILMAIKEYLQDLLKFTEHDLIYGRPERPAEVR